MTAERIAAAARAFLDSLPEEGRAEELLERIHVMRVATQVQMVGVLHTLDSWLESHPAVRRSIGGSDSRSSSW
jgi:RAD51-like protein 2